MKSKTFFLAHMAIESSSLRSSFDTPRGGQIWGNESIPCWLPQRAKQTHIIRLRPIHAEKTDLLEVQWILKILNDFPWHGFPWCLFWSISWGPIGVFFYRPTPRGCQGMLPCKFNEGPCRGERTTETRTAISTTSLRQVWDAPQLRVPSPNARYFLPKEIGCHQSLGTKFFWGSLERWWNSILDDDFFLLLRTLRFLRPPLIICYTIFFFYYQEVYVYQQNQCFKPK